MKIYNNILLIAIVLTLIAGCKGDIGPAGINDLISTTDEPSGSNCISGGLRIDTGHDSNRNGILDPSEIESTKYVCNASNGTTIDQIRFQVFNSAGGNSTSPYIYKGLLKFNIDDYPGMDSVVFLVEDAASLNANSNLIFGLYDITNQATILNSTIQTNSTTRKRLVSGNLYKYFPKSEIDLGLSVACELNGASGDETGGAYLFLYRKK